MTDAPSPPARAHQLAAESARTLATLSWALPLVFAVAYVVADAFSVRKFFLLSGHISLVAAASLLTESSDRLRAFPKARKAASTAAGLGLASCALALYALYPTIRTLAEKEDAVFAWLDAADPGLRLAYTMWLIYALVAAAATFWLSALAKVASSLGERIEGRGLIVGAFFVVAASAAALHACFVARPELDSLRELFAAGLLLGASTVAFRLRGALVRLAEALDARAQRVRLETPARP